MNMVSYVCAVYVSVKDHIKLAFVPYLSHKLSFIMIQQHKKQLNATGKMIESLSSKSKLYMNLTGILPDL